MGDLSDIRDKYAYCPETGEFRWKVRPGRVAVKVGDLAGYANGGYWQLCYNGRGQAAHRVAWFIMTGEYPKHTIDHINCDKLDNRWVNLREATRSQNAANRAGWGRYGKGVGRNSWSGRYVASIYHQGTHHYLGTFDTKEDAQRAYEVAATRLFGEFARVA